VFEEIHEVLFEDNYDRMIEEREERRGLDIEEYKVFFDDNYDTMIDEKKLPKHVFFFSKKNIF
jgi:hypothetical protein